MVGAVPTAKMQVYERERGKILADSERGERRKSEGMCELVRVERGWNTKQRSEYWCQNYHKVTKGGTAVDVGSNHYERIFCQVILCNYQHHKLFMDKWV